VLNAIPAVANAVTTSYINDGAVTQAKLASGVAGNGPAFNVYVGSAFSCSAGASTKIQFNTENFDTASCFDSTTNYRFTPNVAGYYQFNLHMLLNGVSATQAQIYKNGSQVTYGTYNSTANNAQGTVAVDLIYCNGSTDYIEFYIYSSATVNSFTGQTYCGASGFLARAA
jgi:hypothetical protein